MYRLVDQRAAALGVHVAAPAALGVVRRFAVPEYVRTHGLERAQLARLKYLAQRLYRAIVAVLEYDRQMAVRIRDHFVRRLNRRSHRLLGQNKLARLNGIQSHRCVQIVRRAKMYRVDVLARNQIVIVRIYRRLPAAGVLAVVERLLSALGTYVAYGDDAHVVHAAQAVEMHGAYSAATDYAYLYRRVHCSIPPLIQSEICVCVNAYAPIDAATPRFSESIRLL